MVAAPSQARAQSLFDLLAALRQGGGWISLPVERGRAQVKTRALPTSGLELNGCLRVWHGHSGRWHIRAEDTYTGQTLERRAASNEPVSFSVDTGPWAQLDVEVEWSEPRDTTLIMWVGLRRPGRAAENGRDPCEPVYSGGGR